MTAKKRLKEAIDLDIKINKNWAKTNGLFFILTDCESGFSLGDDKTSLYF